MKSPDHKTITFLFVAVPGTKAEHFWSARVTVPPGSVSGTMLSVSAECGDSSPVEKGVFEFMGCRVKLSGGEGRLAFGDFVKGIHETGVWMMRPGHPPVPGALTFG